MLPKFAQKLSDAEANEGKQCILKCKIDCVPPPKVQWFKGGSEITKDPRVKVQKNNPICKNWCIASRKPQTCVFIGS